MKRIVVEVEGDGKVVLRTEGFRGSTCLVEAEKLIGVLREMGVDVETKSIQKTREFYVAERQHV